MLSLPIEDILKREAPPPSAGEKIGTSREGRDLVGFKFGYGPNTVSLIGGCHADEPVGPAMLDQLAAHLHDLGEDDALLSKLSWVIVPHTNPDGEARNASWTEKIERLCDGKTSYDLASYMRGTVRERPGDDVEFGFPRSAQDTDARPENQAVAAFLRSAAPFVLHGTFHGMAFAAGPWFLMESAWIDRTSKMRDRLRQRTRDLGYILHDIDRKGDKGFHRIDEGFTTRPDSRAMVAYFEERNDPEMARRFRPSSMEYVRCLGGDPLTLVSEMPLFLLPVDCYGAGDVVSPPVLDGLAAATTAEDLRREAARIGARAMPIEDQMRLQLAFLEEGLEAVIGPKS